MKYYKHSELVREYSVSDRTIRNWVEASLQGKVDLKLYEEKGRFYVANSIGNNAVLERLAQSGKKYRNSRSSKTVEPKPEFYQQFNPYQVSDIVNILEKNREFSWYYSYFGEAAEYWDEYQMELHSVGKGNLITNTIDALKFNYPYLEALAEPYDYVNIINICTGNNVAVYDLLSRFKASGKLKRFIAADISSDMLDVAERNIEKWFDGKVKMERCVMDIRNQPLNIFENEDRVGGSMINIFLMVAGPIVNFDNPQRVLQTVNASMRKEDVFITTTKRDSPKTRYFFDFNTKSDSSLLGFRRQKFLELLNIDESFYEVEQSYDEDKLFSYMNIKLKVNLRINFSTAGLHRSVEFEKGDSILMWRAYKFTDEEMTQLLSEAGFDQLLTAQTMDNELLLTVSRPRINTL